MQQEKRPATEGTRPLPSAGWRSGSWRTPAVVLICGCLISMVGFGPRSTLGFFLTPMSSDQGWGREVFALSVAIQTLLYGAAQPFSGAIADRFGTVRVIIAGLDQDFRGAPFGPMPQLMALAEDVTKLHAICAVCGLCIASGVTR